MGKTRPLTQTPNATGTESPQSGRSTKSGAKRTEFAHDDPHAVASTVLQNFSYSDEDCLAKYKALSTLQDFNGAFPGNLQEKLIRGALKANEGSLPCFLCQKVLSSSVGLVLHIKKCQGSPEAEKVDVTPPKPVRPSLVPKRRLTISVSSLEQLKDEPSLWLRINEKEKLNLLKQFFPDGRIECFAIHKDDEICSLFFDYKEAITHLDSSIKPMYLTFVAKGAEFRKLDKKVRSRYVREGLRANLELPCLECGRMFRHQYGLMYHVERCNVSEEEMPWKCYRCGFHTTRAESYKHLELCWGEAKLQLDKEELTGAVMGGLGDVNLRSGKSILKGASETIMINGEAKPLSELSAQEALEALIGPGKSIKGKKRRSAANNRVSISAGLIPESATRMSLTGDGKMRFKFRKADARGCLSGISEYPKYLEHVMEAHKQWAQETAALPYCGRLLDIEASVWQTAYESSHLPFISKESVGFRIRETDDKSGHEKVPETCERLRVFSSTELKREIYDHVTIAYCGGPINTISIAPNTMPGNEEVVAIVAYPCDTSLVGKDMMKTSSYIQFWMHKCKGLRSSLLPWFVLKSNFGVVFDAHWLDRPKPSEDSTLIGLLAVATAQGALLIYRLDSTTVSTALCNPKRLPVVEPEPDLILYQTRQWHSDDQSHEENAEQHFPPSLTSIAWCSRGEAQYVVAVNAAGGVVIWDIQRSTDAPYVLLDSSWCSPATNAAFINGFEVAVAFRERVIRVYDVRTYQCTLEEGTVRTAGARATSQPRIFSGFFTFQSEYFAAGEVPSNGVSFVCTEAKSDGFFVVPLANRHELMTWDVSASSQNAVVVSCGLDGKLLLSSNGRLVTAANTADYGFSLMRTALTIVRKRTSSPEEESIQELVCKMEIPEVSSKQPSHTDEEKKKRARPAYMTHEESVENLWLDIHLNPDSQKLRSQTQFSCLDLRIESLNRVATNFHTGPCVFTGGQAGLIFIRPCVIDAEKPLINNVLNFPVESNEKPFAKLKKT